MAQLTPVRPHHHHHRVEETKVIDNPVQRNPKQHDQESRPSAGTHPVASVLHVARTVGAQQ
jgi:hypothetical protein